MDRTMNTLAKPQLRALVLDQDAAAVREVRRALEARCFSVVSAADGTSGLELLLGELLDLDVLVMDVDLPERDARSFADLVRRAGGERDLAIVVLASDATRATRSELLALGVDAVVDRAAGAEAAAAAAHEAVAARTRSNGHSPQRAAAPVDPAPSARDGRWALAIGRWSLLPA